MNIDTHNILALLIFFGLVSAVAVLVVKRVLENLKRRRQVRTALTLFLASIDQHTISRKSAGHRNGCIADVSNSELPRPDEIDNNDARLLTSLIRDTPRSNRQKEMHRTFAILLRMLRRSSGTTERPQVPSHVLSRIKQRDNIFEGPWQTKEGGDGENSET